ncbi:MFS general substrate transporter [Lentinula aciculospora]|uniref:MFS general substrate transporter n=1 Tax=Lentinula aciculospora TaxID=153920 RepID=A0A9W9ANP4_9AGAR|nr:MFS general substrate transporter [Lentinula aciculospora]
MIPDIELDTLPTIIRQSVRQISSAELKPSPDHASERGRPRYTASNQLEDRTLGSSIQQTKEQVIRSRAQFTVTCCCMFAIGFNDASAGPLLPRMQSVYQISFLIVSLLFIFACVGFILGACLNVLVSEHVAFGKVIILYSTCILQMIAFTLVIPALPFPVFVLGYFINGVGSALQLAQVNGYLVVMDHNVNGKVALSQASYGAGAFVAPLVATQFSAMRHWSFHYLVSLGMVTINAFSTSAIFRLRSKEDCRAQLGLEPMELVTSEHSPFRQIMSLKSVHILAAFIFLYVGTEVCGWTVTYIVQQRDAGSNSGYIASGFWGGILLGRIILIPLNNWLGDRLVMLIYIFLAIGLEIVVWLVPSLIGDAVAVSLVGLFFGPMFPVALSASRKVIPRWIYTGAIGWITGIGQAGSAALPFLTGALADAVGIRSLQPLLVGMMSAMIATWLLVPRPTRPD